ARCGASTYLIRQPEHHRVHLPSHVYRPAHSPALARFIDHVEVVIAVHGYGRRGQFFTLLAGGSNRALAAHLAGCLAPRLPDYRVEHDLARIPRELRGLHPGNPVNLPRGGGVQLELPVRVRGLGPFWGDQEGAPGLRPHTEALVEGIAAAVDSWAQPVRGLS
ncbi:MAG: poly-gamma-glutamate hydrolase family protein, partial [Frankiaceae bacterium]|nr:poly-gamma-glutamate hydrolase family protein [Frankiaceae bacterium]